MICWLIHVLFFLYFLGWFDISYDLTFSRGLQCLCGLMDLQWSVEASCGTPATCQRVLQPPWQLFEYHLSRLFLMRLYIVYSIFLPIFLVSMHHISLHCFGWRNMEISFVCVFLVKLDIPISFEVNSIDQNKLCQGINWSWCNQFLELDYFLKHLLLLFV